MNNTEKINRTRLTVAHDRVCKHKGRHACFMQPCYLECHNMKNEPQTHELRCTEDRMRFVQSYGQRLNEHTRTVFVRGEEGEQLLRML